MTAAEIAHRALRALTLQAQRRGLVGSSGVPPPDFVPAPRPWIHKPAGIDPDPYLAAADRLAADRIDVFALRGVALGSPPRWGRDPKTGREGPLVFGMALDYRDPHLVGDIKYVWELNRHLHLVTLAQAHALSGRERYAQVIGRHLLSWCAACPFRLGPNWSSALEAALRLINWAAAWQLLGGVRSAVFAGTAGALLRERWLQSVYEHARFIGENFSRHSSANNHLIGEGAGLFVAAVTWPHWPGVVGWRERAQAILEREALRQNAPDGVNREQAVSYQQFVLELLLLSLLAGRANGVEFAPGYVQRLERMLEYLASIIDVAGHAPMIGDADDGIALPLAPGPASDHARSLLATGALVFRRGDFKAKAGRLDDRTRWLIGSGAALAYAGLDRRGARLPVRQAFADGGYYILGSAFETADEIRVVVDAGALGYGALAAHGHADALAFTLSVGGCEFLVDPGTYAYHASPRWRSYFRGTGAHNTVRIDGLDQSLSGGAFMWLRKARASCNAWQSTATADVFEGWHDGYTRLADPVLHRRRITLDKPRRRVTIDDVLQMNAAHDVELLFHCSETCAVAPAGERLRLSCGGRTVELALPPSDRATVHVYRGSVDPVFGWVSRHYDRKSAAPTIVWCARLRGAAVLRSALAC